MKKREVEKVHVGFLNALYGMKEELMTILMMLLMLNVFMSS